MADVSAKAIEALTALEPQGDVDAKLTKVLDEALIRRLHHYQYVDRRMQQKYSMPFAEFREQHVVAQRGYCFEVESDFWEWELAVDGIATIERRLSELRQTADDGC